MELGKCPGYYSVATGNINLLNLNNNRGEKTEERGGGGKRQ